MQEQQPVPQPAQPPLAQGQPLNPQGQAVPSAGRGLPALLQSDKVKQFILYCICGGMGVVSHLAVYYVALHFGLQYQLANALGYLSGTLLSFFLNRVITFGVVDKTGQRLLLFLLVAGCGYLASAGLLWLLVDIVKLPKFWALIPTLPVVVALQFGLNKKITFRTTRAG